MPFDFLGTFNRSQFERFLVFARSQLPLVQDRRLHLVYELNRVGAVVMQFDKGVPQGYTGTPETSYIAKLLRAYEVLGGDAMKDLRLRQRTDPIYIVQGDLLSGPQYTSGGEPIGGRGLSDGPTAVLMQRAKSWLGETTYSRFGRLERKIRRTMDYADQLQRELDALDVIQKAAETKGSLEFIAAQIEQYLSDNNYRAIYDDQATGKADPLGLLNTAILSAYDVEKPTDPNEPARVATGPQKQFGGAIEAGEEGGTPT
jgi:hypothetical protein